MKPEQSDIENEIQETGSLEASSAITNVPNTMVRRPSLFDAQPNHTDTGVDVVVDTDIDVDVDIDEDVAVDMSGVAVDVVIDVDVDEDNVVDIDIDTHVDQ
ncbi:MAG TPA: hypothetical protein VE961_14230 [Pyrinomonadaceae bacterium]|nr:hypothetical protein [Pyrinomonadaceae bacterium]